MNILCGICAKHPIGTGLKLHTISYTEHSTLHIQPKHEQNKLFNILAELGRMVIECDCFGNKMCQIAGGTF